MLPTFHRQIIVTGLWMVTLGLSFLTGRLSIIQKHNADQPITVLEDLSRPEEITSLLSLLKGPDKKLVQQGLTSSDIQNAKFVASHKSVSRKFYPIESPHAGKIKEENRIYFESKEAALEAGYSPQSGS